MGAFHVFKITQMVPNHETHHKLVFLENCSYEKSVETIISYRQKSRVYDGTTVVLFRKSRIKYFVQN